MRQQQFDTDIVKLIAQLAGTSRSMEEVEHLVSLAKQHNPNLEHMFNGVELTAPEVNTVLAALRYMMVNYTKALKNALVRGIATNGGEHDPLTLDELEAIGDKISG